MIGFDFPLSSITATSSQSHSHFSHEHGLAGPDLGRAGAGRTQPVHALRPASLRADQARPGIRTGRCRPGRTRPTLSKHTDGGGLKVVDALVGLELDEELLGLPDAVLVGAVDVGGGDLALLGVDEGLGLLVLGKSGHHGERGGGDGLVDLGDPLVGVGGDGVVGVDGDGRGTDGGLGAGATEGVVGADGGVHARGVLRGGDGGGHEGEDDEGNLGGQGDDIQLLYIIAHSQIQIKINPEIKYEV